MLLSSVSNSSVVQNGILNLSKRYSPLWKVSYIAGRSVSIVRPVSTSYNVIFRKSRILISHFLKCIPFRQQCVFLSC